MTRTFRSIALSALALLSVLPWSPAQATGSAQVAKLLAASEPRLFLFGSEVALDGDTVLIGADYSAFLGDDNGSGSAYVFTRDGDVWTQQQKLVPVDGTTDVLTVVSVALDGDTALVGVSKDEDRSGSVYVFTRAGGIWTQRQTLVVAAPAGSLGNALALDGDTALIGAYHDRDFGSQAGSAYVFTRTNGLWSEQQKLLAADGATFDEFGGAVALDGDTALIGSRYDDDNERGSGSAYVFTLTDGTWGQQQKLLAADGGINDQFGAAVALDGDTVLIGATGDDDQGPNSGAAYAFTRTGGAWSERQKLSIVGAERTDGFDGFGVSIALDGDTAVIGGADGTDSAHAFTRSEGTWIRQRKLVAADGAPGDLFGRSVALDGDTALIGSRNDDDNGTNSGSAYVFDLSIDAGTDGDEDGVVDTEDNCPLAFNPLQEDFDADRFGDACDLDDDADGVLDEDDNCPLAVNPDQLDGDGDGIGDLCDEDVIGDEDEDGVYDTVDLCPATELGIRPTVGATKSRFYSTDVGTFVDGRGTVSAITVAETGGCSGQQIIAASRLSDSNLRYGLWDYELERWANALAGLDDAPGTDVDGDGVGDDEDLCPGTVLGIEPTVKLTKGRYYSTPTGLFVDGRGTISPISLADAGGCSGQQIIAAGDHSSSNERYGLWGYLLEAWAGGIDAE